MSTILNTMTKSLQLAMLAGIVTVGTSTAFTPSAQAMVVYNCVDDARNLYRVTCAPKTPPIYSRVRPAFEGDDGCVKPSYRTARL